MAVRVVGWDIWGSESCGLGYLGTVRVVGLGYLGQ